MKFRHHPDGWIFINDFMLPVGEFRLDEPNYTLPPGMIGRTYEPGVRHVLTDGRTQYGGPMPWAEGDRYIANEATYRANYEARRQAEAPEPPPEPTLEDAKAARRAILEREYETAIVSGFTSSALGSPHRYKSDPISQTWLVGAVAAGESRNFECVELETGIRAIRLHTPEQLLQVLRDGAALAESYKVTFETLAAQIEAATTFEELEQVGHLEPQP